jgi:glutaredoxin
LFFHKQITPTEGQYAKYDFFDETTNYEVKSRTNNYSKYPTTMITWNKCCDCDRDKDLILLFNFTDGLYYIKFDEELFKLYQRDMFSRANIAEDEKQHIYIPISHLTPIVIYGGDDCSHCYKRQIELNRNIDSSIRPNGPTGQGQPLPALSKSGGF